MAKYVGQIAGEYFPWTELMNEVKINSFQKAKTIIKIGVQLEEGNIIILNNKYFQIGKTHKLEFDNVNITSIKIGGEEREKLIPIIIDYVYIDEEE